MKEAESSKVKCWYCTRPLDITKPFDFIPMEAGKAEDRPWEFSGPGYFHFNMRCMRSYVTHIHDVAARFPNLARNVTIYARERHGLTTLPAPFLARELLEDFGGHMTWKEWVEAAQRDEWYTSWQLRDYIEANMNRHPNAVCVHHQTTRVVQNKIADIPGVTDILDAFIL